MSPARFNSPSAGAETDRSCPISCLQCSLLHLLLRPPLFKPSAELRTISLKPPIKVGTLLSTGWRRPVDACWRMPVPGLKKPFLEPFWFQHKLPCDHLSGTSDGAVWCADPWAQDCEIREASVCCVQKHSNNSFSRGGPAGDSCSRRTSPDRAAGAGRLSGRGGLPGEAESQLEPGGEHRPVHKGSHADSHRKARGRWPNLKAARRLCQGGS